MSSTIKKIVSTLVHKLDNFTHQAHTLNYHSVHDDITIHVCNHVSLFTYICSMYVASVFDKIRNHLMGECDIAMEIS